MTRHTTMVLLAAGAIGAIVGGVCVPTWQDAVELAQVHAGVVAYHPGDPFFLYAMRTWSLVVQIPAVLLSWGLTERTVSIILSAAMGAISFQALGMTVLATSGDAWLASLAPGFIYAVHATHGGVTYPVYLAGTNYTYGVFGLSSALLAIALIVAGAPRPGALLLGVLPAIHLSIACWTIPLVVAAIVWQRRGRVLWSSTWRWGLAGVAIALGSLIVHLLREPAVAAADRAQAGAYLTALLTFWDRHRQPAPLTLQAIGPWLIGMGVSLVALWRRDVVPSTARPLAACVVIAGVTGVVALVLRWLPFSALPGLVWVLMPSRMMNLPILSAAAILIGLAGRGIGASSRRVLLRMATLGVLAAATVLAMAAGARPVDRRLANLADRTNDAFMATTAARPGVLLTGPDVSWMQLRTRRPVLAGGVLIDALVYVPEVGAAMNRVVLDAYGVDLLHPPFGAKDASGELPAPFVRSVWETRTADDWRRLHERLGVTDVVTYADWRLPLREIARTPIFVLYATP